MLILVTRKKGRAEELMGSTVAFGLLQMAKMIYLSTLGRVIISLSINKYFNTE